MKTIIIILCLPVLFMQCTFSQSSNSKKEQAMEKQQPENPVYSRNDSNKIALSDDEWKKILSPEVYRIARQKGTERPYSSHFDSFKEVGTYFCAACGNALFNSDTKFDSGCGWPSFYEPVSKSSIIYTPDHALGMTRTEVQCGRCKAHLGHVFDDGPPPTGLRYCINGVVLDFDKAQEAEKKYNKNQQP